MEKLSGLSHLFVTVFLYFMGMYIITPAITDVTMLALCPGRDECSLAIYLSGFQQAIIGLGTVVMTPIIGNLSDKHGRKSLLTLPLILSIIPLAILAYRRTTNFFYAYYVVNTLTSMICQGSVNCLALAYVADKIPEQGRASAFGILSGVTSSTWVFGTLAARFLSTESTFKVAAFTSMTAAVYMRVFLKESIPDNEDDSLLSQPILNGSPDVEKDGESPRKTQISNKKIPAVRDIIYMLKSNKTFSQAAIVSFFNSLSEGGFQACLLYYLKARFHFSKDQFSTIMLIAGIAGTVSQLLLLPLMAPIGEERLLSLGLFVGCINIFVYSISWSAWVPYVCTMFTVFSVFAYPTVRSIASKQVGSSEQGKAQGCLTGISSFASIVSPFIFSPLAALFLSEKAPFYYPGFSIMCVGLATMFAFIQSMMIRAVPPPSILT